jgi:hypothetical protein
MTNVKYGEDAVLAQILEDMEDLEDAEARMNEPRHSFDDLVLEFKKEGLLA